MGEPEEYEGLIHELCVRLGFCGCVDEGGRSKHVDDFLPKAGAVTAQQFAEWAIRADWPNDDYDGANYRSYCERWIGPLAELFVKHIGADTADVAVVRAAN